jgi:hypothetical protein
VGQQQIDGDVGEAAGSTNGAGQLRNGENTAGTALLAEMAAAPADVLFPDDSRAAVWAERLL